MSFGDAIRTCVQQKYANFNGRARRSEYWFFYLAVLVAYVVAQVLSLASNVLGTLLLVVVFLGAVVPTLAAGSRRLHDTGKSGWLQLIVIVPFLGGIALLVLLALDGNPDSNRYGPNPKAVGSGGYAPPPAW